MEGGVSGEFVYRVADEVFAKYPGYVRGVVLAFDVRNGPAAEELTAALRAAEAGLRERLELATLAEQPRIKSWREAYRAFGAKPSEFRSSIEALARRALRSDPLPSINTLVDIGNLVSLQYLVPAGAHAIDRLEGDLALRPARGDEVFVALGSETVEHPEPGEIIFAEGDVVLTRRWTWRQGQRTLTLPETTAVEFNVDGLPPVTRAEVEEICEAVAALVRSHCGGTVRWEVLTPERPTLSLT
jgi:DNA/RNA-binding domain of Phe-tRNA-synthetase-like protein